MPTSMLAEKDLVELLYQDKSGPLTVDIGFLDKYVQGCNELGQEPAFYAQSLPSSIEEATKSWYMPQEYFELDLEMFFAEKIKTVEEAHRVAEELSLFKERGLEPMLRFMIYLVHIMKENKIIWGVGRGSSVSSFLLYLVGLHQINPIKYDLDIKEFIR